MSLLESSGVYRPFRYQWAYDFWKKQQQVHWLPEEVPLHDDCKDWNQNLEPSEKNLLTQIFRFFTQADVDVMDCFAKGTEILTPRGFVNFEDLNEDELVAQVHPQTMRVEFVKPLRKIHRKHTGKMVRFKNGGGQVSSLVTPNHEMFYERVNTLDHGTRYKETAENLIVNRNVAFHTAALAPEEGVRLTDEERLLIAFQADGSKANPNGKMVFGFKKVRKITRMRELLQRLPYNYREEFREHKLWGTYTFFVIDYPNTNHKDFSWVDLSRVSRAWCEDFMEEVSHWDSWISGKGNVQYRSTDKNSASMVDSIRVLAGYRGKIVECDYGHQSNHHMVTFTTLPYQPIRLQNTTKEFVDVEELDVYCVTVPTGVIITRYEGASLICGNCYHTRYSQVFKPIEIKMMLNAFSNMESIHVAGYSHLLDTVGMPESEYAAFMNIKAMRDKHDYMAQFGVDTDENIAKTMAMFGGFTEGLQLFASFAMLMNFPRFQKMKGMGQIVTWSVRDETLHCEGIIKLYHTFCEERQCLTPGVKDDIIDMCKKTVEIEDAFIDTVFEMGPVKGMNPEDIKKYIRFIANWRLTQLRLPTLYDIEDHPIPWLIPLLNGVEHANFFEQRATNYSRGSTTGNWNETWGLFDKYNQRTLTTT